MPHQEQRKSVALKIQGSLVFVPSEQQPFTGTVASPPTGQLDEGQCICGRASGPHHLMITIEGRDRSTFTLNPGVALCAECAASFHPMVATANIYAKAEGGTDPIGV